MNVPISKLEVILPLDSKKLWVWPPQTGARSRKAAIRVTRQSL